VRDRKWTASVRALAVRSRECDRDAFVGQHSTGPGAGQLLGTAEGGPAHWAIDDTLCTLRELLKRRGIPCPWEAIVEARKLMLTADYVAGG
jgi:hypothetical protein